MRLRLLALPIFCGLRSFVIPLFSFAASCDNPKEERKKLSKAYKSYRTERGLANARGKIYAKIFKLSKKDLEKIFCANF
ncbi:MAG: hypothetical protein DBX55_03295 [Verrucomicrobia bacterium]|nr:MAG: hypothetical protein DBX55_03295 [Verrucomicrobiota bacterium]